MVGPRSPEQQNMRFRIVHHEVQPTRALLDSEIAPLGLRHEVGLWHQAGDVWWKDDMPEIKKNMIVIVNIKLKHGYCCKKAIISKTV